jgi:hypothetical protein
MQIVVGDWSHCLRALDAHNAVIVTRCTVERPKTLREFGIGGASDFGFKLL